MPCVLPCFLRASDNVGAAALRPRTNSLVAVSKYPGHGLPSGVYSAEALAPASAAGALPMLKSVHPLPRREPAGRGRGRDDAGFGFGGAAPPAPYKAGLAPSPAAAAAARAGAPGVPGQMPAAGRGAAMPAWGGATPAKVEVDFFYKDAMGERQGPCGSGKLLEWHQAGLFTSDMLVSRDGSNFVKLSEAVNLKTGQVKGEAPASAPQAPGADDLASLSRNTGDLQRIFQEEKRSLHEQGAAPIHQRLDALGDQPPPDAGPPQAAAVPTPASSNPGGAEGHAGLPAPESLGLPPDTPPEIIAAGAPKEPY